MKLGSTTAVLLACGVAVAALAEDEDSLPLASKVLLEKLGKYEKELDEGFETAIRSGRKAAMSELTKHQRAELEAGRFQSAVAAQKAVAALSGGTETKEPISLPDLSKQSQLTVGKLHASESRLAKERAGRKTSKRDAVIKVLKSHLAEARQKNDTAKVAKLEETVASLSAGSPKAGAWVFPIEIDDTSMEIGGRRVSYVKGFVVWEFPRAESQSGSEGGFVPQDKLGKPSGKPRIVKSLHDWHFKAERNAKAVGFLKIEEPGEYVFTSYNFYDRNALYVGNMDEPLCPYRDLKKHEHEITLKKGMIPIVSVGYVHSRGQNDVQWKPPGADAFAPIPDELLFHTKELKAAP